MQLVKFHLPCVVESGFFCHDRKVEAQSRCNLSKKKTGNSSESQLVASCVVLLHGWGDSGGAVDGNGANGGGSGLMD